MSHSAAATITARAGIAQDTAFGAVTPPLYLTSTYELPAFRQPGQYDYSRSNNPTRDTLAEALCQLEQGARAIVTGSGMSACLLALQLLGPDDTLVIPHDCYGGSYRLFTNLATRKQAFKLVLINFQESDWSEQVKAAAPAMIWLETPSNPLLQITDIKAVCQLAKNLSAKVVVDNTFLSPVLQQPLRLGADIVVHSTTKYINGHSDIVGGVLVAKDPVIGDELKWWANCLGVTGPAFDSYMTLRGLRTLVPRLQLQQQNTNELVSFLQRQPLVSKLYYPGLTDHPGHAVAKAQQTGFGAMCSFDLAAPAEALPVFFASLQLFTLAQSLGGIESLICHPGSMTHASMDAAAQQTAGIGPTLIRLSVGIEASADLIADLQAGFNAVANWLNTSQHNNNADRVASGNTGTGKGSVEQQFRLNPALTAFW
ncbi:cystathionine gamma-synthase [Arsukibacterium tuosuense]|uniref:Cystathionine gamma-synthase n=1 Tax=Arsukibacterium tuosuense TaxID=1323745 RepID=A0A285JBM1_9GAMM|nr:cystathionine gamma-synthase [Arsukibacterium tuosuense]SNY57648.1 cystathionine gamma-synthase [Arsukibacterium tuosuense]